MFTSLLSDGTNWFAGSGLLMTTSQLFSIQWRENARKTKTATSILLKQKLSANMFRIWWNPLGMGVGWITIHDIGVVSPYKAQCQLLQAECGKVGAANVTIGTAEIFQGQERPIIIVSTVRTDGEIGFVAEPRVRFTQYFNIRQLLKIVTSR